MGNILHFFQISSGLDVELFRLTFVASLVISLIVTQQKKNVPIGIIAPGTIILLAGYPFKLLMVFLISLLVYGTAWIIQKYLLPHHIFAAREKLLMFVLLSVAYSFIFSAVSVLSIEVLTAGSIGIVLPAMIAENLTKARRIARISSFLIATLATGIFFVVIKFLANLVLSPAYKAELNLLYPPTPELATQSIMVMYLLFAVATLFNIVLYRKMRFKSSGLLLGAYLGLLLFQPTQIVFIMFVILLSFLVIKNLFPHTMLYGYRIFVVAILIVSSFYSMAELLSFQLTHGTFHPFLGMHIAGIVVCGLLVSELLQHGYKKVVLGSASMSVIIASLLILVQSISHLMHGNFLISSLLNRTDASSHIAAPYNTNKSVEEERYLVEKKVTIATLMPMSSCPTSAISESITEHNHLRNPNTAPTATPLSTSCILH